MASDSIYEGYRLWFSRNEKHLFHALIPIDPNAPKKDIGHLYQLSGHVSFDVELRITERFNLDNSRSLKAKAKVFWMPQSFRERFELIVSQTELPFDPRALADTDPGLAPLDGRKWINDVVRKTNFQVLNAAPLLETLNSRVGSRELASQ